MKKLIFATTAIFVFNFANAQDEPKAYGFTQGDLFLEGNVGFSTSTATESDITGDYLEEKSSSFSFNPKVGYFVSDKFAFGVELFIGSSNNEDTDLSVIPSFTTETKASSIGAGVFARYYLLELGERFKTYSELGLGYSSTKIEASATGSPILLNDVKNSAIGVGLGLGMQYFVTPNMAINFGLSDILSYSSGKTTDNLSITNTERKASGFSGNLNIFNNFFTTAQFGMTFKL